MFGFKQKNKHKHDFRYQCSCYYEFKPCDDNYGLKIYDVYMCNCGKSEFKLRTVFCETFLSHHDRNVKVAKEDCIKYTEALRKYKS